jgi:hypothetical protein
MPWGKKLARPLALKDGTVIKTLNGARAVILKRFEGVIHSEALAHAGQLLLKAAETGDKADIEAATVQLERVLRASHAISRRARSTRSSWMVQLLADHQARLRPPQLPR